MATRPTPTTETKSVSEARRTFSETLNRVYRGETRVIVEKNGIAVGALVSAQDLERLQRLEARRAEQWAAVDRLRDAFADVDPEELEAEIGRAVEKGRTERCRAAGG